MFVGCHCKSSQNILLQASLLREEMGIPQLANLFSRTFQRKSCVLQSRIWWGVARLTHGDIFLTPSELTNQMGHMLVCIIHEENQCRWRKAILGRASLFGEIAPIALWLSLNSLGDMKARHKGNRIRIYIPGGNGEEYAIISFTSMSAQLRVQKSFLKH